MVRDEQLTPEMHDAVPAGVNADTHIYVNTNPPIRQPGMAPAPIPTSPQIQPIVAPILAVPVSPNVSSGAPTQSPISAERAGANYVANQSQGQPSPSYGGGRSAAAGPQGYGPAPTQTIGYYGPPAAQPQGAAAQGGQAPVYQTFIGTTPANEQQAAPQRASRPAVNDSDAPIPASSWKSSQAVQEQSAARSSSSETSRSSSSSAAYAPGSLTRNTTTQQITTRTHSLDGPRTVKKTSVNWGGIVKGVAVITAVVLVGVAAYAGVSSLAGSAMSNPTVSAIAANVAEAAEPVVSAVGNGVEWIKGFAPHIIPAIKGFFNALFGVTASGAAASGGTAVAASTLSPAAATATAKTLGLVAGAGALTYGVSHFMAPTIEHTHLANHSLETITPSDQVHVQTIVDTQPGHFVSADKAHAAADAAHSASHATDQAAELGLQSHEYAHASHSSRGHHDGAQADNDMGNAGDNAAEASPQEVDADVEDINRRIAGRAQRHPGRRESASREGSWLSRVSSNGFADKAKNGGYTAAVEGTRNEPDFKQRGGDYVGGLAEDRANLDLVFQENGR